MWYEKELAQFREINMKFTNWFLEEAVWFQRGNAVIHVIVFVNSRCIEFQRYEVKIVQDKWISVEYRVYFCGGVCALPSNRAEVMLTF